MSFVTPTSASTPFDQDEVQAISDRGLIVGRHQVDGQYRVYAGRHVTGLADIGIPPGRTGVMLESVNERDHLLVRAYGGTSDDRYSFYLWRAGTWTPIVVGDADAWLDVPAGGLYQPLNDRDQIVLDVRKGVLSDSPTAEAHLWSEGRVTNLDEIAGGPRWTTPIGINNRSQVVGTRLDDPSTLVTLLWTPHLPRRH